LLLLLIVIVETKAAKAAGSKPSSRGLLLGGLTESRRSRLRLTKSTKETSRLRLIIGICTEPAKPSRRWLLSLSESGGSLGLVLLSERAKAPSGRLCLP